MNEFTSFEIKDIDSFKIRWLIWANQFETFTYLDSNSITDPYTQYESILAIDAMEYSPYPVFSDEFRLWKEKKFAFGHINYNGTSVFYQPRFVSYIRGNRLYLNRNYPEMYAWYELIMSIQLSDEYHSISIPFQSTISKDNYIELGTKIQEKIKDGAFYELNFCIELMSKPTVYDPIKSFIALNRRAQSPFASLHKYQNNYVICVSPERFVAKRDHTLISQPIKGTIKRDLIHKKNDEELKTQLQLSIKERAENIMIVDLVRNDLTKYAQTGSIKVRELCEIYTFPFVHQMISTIEATLRDTTNDINALWSCHPAGSMTGAPKKEVMKYIQCYETIERGLYAGNIGYFDPIGNFDFNVVIRSIFYNASTHVSSIKVGSALTLLSDLEMEYEECMLKAQGLIKEFIL